METSQWCIDLLQRMQHGAWGPRGPYPGYYPGEKMEVILFASWEEALVNAMLAVQIYAAQGETVRPVIKKVN